MWRAAGPAPGSRLPAYLATTPNRSADHVPAPGCVSDVVRAHCRRFQARDGCGWGGKQSKKLCAVRKGRRTVRCAKTRLLWARVARWPK